MVFTWEEMWGEENGSNLSSSCRRKEEAEEWTEIWSLGNSIVKCQKWTSLIFWIQNNFSTVFIYSLERHVYCFCFFHFIKVISVQTHSHWIHGCEMTIRQNTRLQMFSRAGSDRDGSRLLHDATSGVFSETKTPIQTSTISLHSYISTAFTDKFG